MRKPLHALLAGSIALLAVGCEMLPMEPFPVLDSAPTPGLADYYAETQALSDGELRRRLNAARNDGARDETCGEAAMHSVVLLAHLGGADNTREASARLSACLLGADAGALTAHRRHVALVLDELLDERLARLDAESRNERLGEETRRIAAELETVREKLEGLKAIERSIQQRDQRNTQ